MAGMSASGGIDGAVKTFGAPVEVAPRLHIAVDLR